MVDSFKPEKLLSSRHSQTVSTKNDSGNRSISVSSPSADVKDTKETVVDTKKE